MRGDLRNRIQRTLRGTVIALVVGVLPSQARDLSVGAVLDDMPVRERTSYIMGVIEGLGYARFRKDTMLSGEKDERGMKCIYEWFYTDNTAALDKIEAAFEQYRQHTPALVVTALVRQECGE